MKIGKIKPAATLVAQFAAGVEVTAIQHEGKMFLPVVALGEFETSDVPTETTTPKKTTTEAPSKKEVVTNDEEETRDYTKDELMEMSTKDLTKILKDDFGIDPNDYDGKNTNKKLRDLILDAQKNGVEASDDDDDAAKDDDAKEEKGEKSNSLADKVADLLEDFDSGTKSKKKVIASICGLVDDADEDAVADLVDKFEDNADADIDEMAEKIAKALDGETSDDEEEEEEKKPSKKSTPKKSKKEKLVDVDDLEVGDKVSVWWDDDNQEWFDGEVSSIKKGKVTIAYDDDTEEVIDPEVHTKIKLID